MPNYDTAKTTGELIKLLQQYPPEMPLESVTADEGGYDITVKFEVEVWPSGNGRLMVRGAD